ncbi:MAG: hypothetical protein CVT67_07695 [Actinobacteria bacterium HGW-Actinobacteria-7]|nr:MAG: hypothetical protein CVT67_07695 [Actinobacteria bacterium HGW-Actinobacteria-7]
MTLNIRRRNHDLLGWLRAALIALTTYGALLGMSFSPAWGAAALGLTAGVLAALSIDLGVLAAIVAIALPLSAANPVIGIAFAVLGIVGIRYLGTDGGSAFLLMAGAIAGAFLGPAWMIVPLAGYLLGAGEGALAAALACICLELLGIALGGRSLAEGVTLHGGNTVLASFAHPPASLFAMKWVRDAIDSIGASSVDKVVAAFAHTRNLAALIIQPLVWAFGAAVSARTLARVRERNSRVLLAAAASIGVLVPAMGAALLHVSATGAASAGPILISATESLVLALAVIFLLESAFPQESVVRIAPARPSTMSMEDADVDELLRLVATAEDRLATQHTTHKIVMITDMKSFSKMTEEDGSIMSAKTIQKHRDLLLPIIEGLGGHGKSTGGDGLVAAFDDARSAVKAAAHMLQALDEHNASHRSEREMAIRVGVAGGEVVLDKGGRPFIGTALNLAARVMNLADGGQAFVTAGVAEGAQGAAKVYSHGSFALKNIASPIEVVEVLWAPGQEPRAPLSSNFLTE